MADMFNTFRDPVYWDWYRDAKGNKTSVLRTNESHVVVNNYIVLMEIPDEYYKVQIEGMSEIPWDKSITNPNQFKVFYTIGWIEFHPSMEGKNVLIKQYYSKGICYIPASRIYTEFDNNGNVTETLQKYVDSLKVFQYKGIYSDEKTYYTNHQVYYNGSTYICLRDGVKGNNPTDTNTWRVLAGGLNRKGNFDYTIRYNERDIVWYEENHTLYLCKRKPPIGTLPTNQNYWDELLTLNDVVSLINNKIDEIENRMSTIENDYNTKKTQWDTDINNKINEAEHKIVNVESRMSTIEDDYNNQKSQWNNTINEKVDEVNDKVLDIETRMTNIETEYENNLKPDILQATQNANDKAQLVQISADRVDAVINQSIKIFKPYVETYTELLSTYPNPENGWTVKVAGEGKVYRWNEIEWVAIDIDTANIELAELKADVGNKNNLTTENKNSLVDAINEVNNKSSFDGDYEKLINKPFIPAKTSDLENDANFETVSGSQEKADQAEQNAKTYTDQQITLVTEALTNVGNVGTELAAHKADYDTFKQDIRAEFDSHKNENTTGAHKAKNIAIDNAEGHFTATDVEGALNELFTSVSDGKTLIATAIADKGIPASGSDTFSQLANKIEQIETEVEGYKVGDILDPSKYLIAPEIWQFTGHTGYVYAVAVDNNGNIYSGGNDKTVRKISPDGNQIWQFTGHTNYVNAVAVDNNGNVYSGSNDRKVRKIDPDGNQIWNFDVFWTVFAVAVDNNGNVYSGSDDKTVRKISYDGNQIWKFTGHTGYVYAIAVDNNGYVYSGSADRTVRKISPDGNQIRQFTGHTDGVRAVAVDNDGNVYSGSYDNTVRKISPYGDQIWQFIGHTWTVYAVAVDNNGNVYSGSYDQTVRKISYDGNQIWQFTGHTNSVNAVAVDNNGNVYSGSNDYTVRKIFDGIKIIA